MNARVAKRKAYAIAAEALRQAMETDIMEYEDFPDADIERVEEACEELRLWLLDKGQDH